jgi:hypothetical protein
MLKISSSTIRISGQLQSKTPGLGLISELSMIHSNDSLHIWGKGFSKTTLFICKGGEKFCCSSCLA